MLVVRLPAPSEPVELSRKPVSQGRRVFTRSSTLGSVKTETRSEPVGQAVPTTLTYQAPRDIQIPNYAHVSTQVEHDLGRVYQSFRQARRIAVVCGAGISVSSPANIPDFRSASGLFASLKQRYPTSGLTSGKDLFDARLFQSESSTALFFAMIAELKDMSDAAQPTLFHHMLRRLDMEGRLQRVYTQNIDGLEEKVGLSFGVGSPEACLPTSKRKRGAQFARSQSDSSVRLSTHPSCEKPLFPRAIPLHGSLSSMTCMLCSHKLRLTREQEAGRQALETLRRGEPVRCEQCEVTDQLRTSAGLRSRGIGRMKVDVVLYNGENDAAEHVGACVERDLLGIRDPHEPDVPETMAETRARERKERQREEIGDLSVTSGSIKAEDALSDAFQSEDQVSDPPARRPRRLKPLPPDMLIVAGTSLKVPGTKRIVREFSKACRIQNADRKKGAHEPPVRVVYMNYDFPSSASEWSGVFDMWIQGDVQQAALGLCEPMVMKEGMDPAVEALVARHSWHAYPTKTPPPRILTMKNTETKRRPSNRLGMVSGKLRTSSNQATGKAGVVRPPTPPAPIAP